MFALGVTAYETFTGDLPWERGTSQEVLRAIVNQDARDPRELKPKTSKSRRGISQEGGRSRGPHALSDAGRIPRGAARVNRVARRGQSVSVSLNSRHGPAHHTLRLACRPRRPHGRFRRLGHAGAIHDHHRRAFRGPQQRRPFRRQPHGPALLRRARYA